MFLKTKIIILLFSVFGVYATAGYFVQQLILLPAFVQLERNAAYNNTERALQALEHDVELLIPTATDWGNWDDTYQYIIDRNSEYMESNLNLTTLDSLKVNLLGLYDLHGRRIWMMAYNYETESELELGELSADSLSPGNPLLADAHTLDTVAGIYHTDAGLFLVASRPILLSNGDGPSRGRIVIGRLLDKAAINRLGIQARVQLNAKPLASEERAVVSQSHQAGIARHTPIELTEDDKVTLGTTDVLDIVGKPVLRFQITTPNNILSQGRTTLRYASMSLTIAGTVVLLLLLVFMRRTVFEPIASLTRHAIAVGTQDDLSARLQMRCKDEIGTLAREFDIMVARLAETRKRLLDQSYQSGISEMASGALHNIGNALTPIGVKLIQLRRDLKAAPLAEMDIARAELADPATPADRKAELAKFSELAGAELASLIARTTGVLETIQSRLDHVQMILADQQRFSRAERLLESLDLHNIANETIDLLPEKLHSIAHIEIDQGLAEIGQARGARIALQQVFSNLFINGADAISESGRQKETGRIRVYPVPQDSDHQTMVHICFEDNGIGISPEHMPHLFERGFSTKTRGSGIGLHWCANTVSAMGGRIYAESRGTGQGACLHLLLPLADKQPKMRDISHENVVH